MQFLLVFYFGLMRILHHTVSEIIAAEVQYSTFSIPAGFLQYIEFGITGYYDPGQLRHAGSQDSDRFPVFVELFEHNPSTLQTDDRRTSCS